MTTTKREVVAISSIQTLRVQIDALDVAIARLITERAKISGCIQTARLAEGGTRVELGRERIIHDHYRLELGPEGPALADVILRICRGRV